MACAIRDVCTFRDDAKHGTDEVLRERERTARSAPSQGPSRGFAELAPTQMLELQMALREHVKTAMLSELEPLRVQLDIQQRKMQQMDFKFEYFSQESQQAKSELAQLSARSVEQKMVGDINPEWEALRASSEVRLSKVESVLGEVAEVVDKFHDFTLVIEKVQQKHDLLTQNLSDLDRRVDRLSSDRAVPIMLPGGRDLETITQASDPFRSHPLESPAALPSVTSKVFMASHHEEVEEFTFQVEKSSGSLGLMLRNDGEVLVIDRLNDGCVLPVNPGDRIVGVNEARSDIKAMLEELRLRGRVTVTCQRLLTTTL